jgi:hypothetical protein
MLFKYDCFLWLVIKLIKLIVSSSNIGAYVICFFVKLFVQGSGEVS